MRVDGCEVIHARQFDKWGRKVAAEGDRYDFVRSAVNQEPWRACGAMARIGGAVAVAHFARSSAEKLDDGVITQMEVPGHL